MYKYIVNPLTNRLVKINGRLGQQILKKYIFTLKGGSSINRDSYVSIESINSLSQINTELQKAMRNQDRNYIKILLNLQEKIKKKKREEEQRKEKSSNLSPCNDNNNNIVVKNDACNNIIDNITGETITQGYCLGKYCMDNDTIQQNRMQYLIPRGDNYNVEFLRDRQAGDMISPYTRKLYTSKQFKDIKLGSWDKIENYINNKDKYSTTIKKYNDSLKRRLDFNAIGSQMRRQEIGRRSKESQDLDDQPKYIKVDGKWILLE
jgi:hypothetical protein